MTILSTAIITFNGKEVRTVLTVGSLASLNGSFENDVAVYWGHKDHDKETIARCGHKMRHAETVIAGYNIKEENYRV